MAEASVAKCCFRSVRHLCLFVTAIALIGAVAYADGPSIVSGEVVDSLIYTSARNASNYGEPQFVPYPGGPIQSNSVTQFVFWSKRFGFSAAQSKAGAGWTFGPFPPVGNFFPADSAVYSEGDGNSFQFANAQSVSSITTHYHAHELDGYKEFLDGLIIMGRDQNGPRSFQVTGRVAPGGNVQIYASSLLGGGSYGSGAVYQQFLSKVIDTPGDFSTILTFPEATFPLPNPGDFIMIDSLSLYAYPGNTGAGATYVTLGGPSEVAKLVAAGDTSIFHVDLPYGHDIEFGPTRIGGTSDKVAMRFVNTSTQGTGISWENGDLSFLALNDNAYLGEFQYRPPGEHSAGVAYPGQSVDIRLHFFPGDHGPMETSFLAPNESTEVVLKGTGVGPIMQISAPFLESPPYTSAVDLGVVAPGAHISKTIQISNASTDPDFGDPTLTDLSFQIDNSQPAFTGAGDVDGNPIDSHFLLTGPDYHSNATVLHEGESATITVEFDATAAMMGRQFKFLRIHHDEGTEFGNLDDRYFDVLLRVNVAYSGDYDGNGVVDAADYEMWKQSFGSSIDLSADGNGDGIVNSADYTVWRDHLGFSAAGAASRSLAHVPEPTAILPILTGSLVTILRIRRAKFAQRQK